MKNILCYGDSNTWGKVAGSSNVELMLAQRFDRNVRWTGVLQKLLGSDFYVIEGGLNGRNTSFDKTRFVGPSRNGLATLPLILEMNYPLDLVIIMLGTNDFLIDYDSTPEKITLEIKKMLDMVKNSHFGHDFSAPQALLIAPAPIHKTDFKDFNLFFNDSSIVKSQQLAIHYANLAHQEGVAFLDASNIVKISDDDGVHIEGNSHSILADAVANKIKLIL